MKGSQQTYRLTVWKPLVEYRVVMTGGQEMIEIRREGGRPTLFAASGDKLTLTFDVGMGIQVTPCSIEGAKKG